MRSGFCRLAVTCLAFAASGLAPAGGQGPGGPADAKNFWIDPVSRNQYFVALQRPEAGQPGVIPELPPGTLPPVALPFDPARPADRGVAIAAAGTVRPAQEASVNPITSGRVTEVLVEAGDVVKAGQVLARVDRTEQELKLKRADARLDVAKVAVMEAEAALVRREAEVRRAEAAVKQAEAQREYAKRKLERLRELLKRQTIEQALVDEAEEQFRAAEARVVQAVAALKAAQTEPERAAVMAAKARVAVSEAERQLARFYVDAAEIRAPAAGTILARHVKLGDGVGPAQANGRPTPLFELADLAHLEVVANVTEKDLPSLAVGQKCEVRFNAVPGAVYAGKVSRIAPVVSPKDRTTAVRVMIELPENDRRLRPGMFGALRILGKE